MFSNRVLPTRNHLMKSTKARSLYLSIKFFFNQQLRVAVASADAGTVLVDAFSLLQ